MMTIENKRLVIIAGIGEGFGSALCHQLLEANYIVIGLARTQRLASEFLHALRHEQLYLLPCDFQDEDSIQRAFESILQIQYKNDAVIDAYIHNANPLVMGNLTQLSSTDFQRAWQLSVLSAFQWTQRLLPYLVKQQSGTLIFTGATASIQGNAGFSAFATAKFALRGFAQSIAREYQPQGIHVVHTLVDGLIDCERTRQRFELTASQMINPQDLAKTYLHLLQQPKSVWTHELDMRPRSETF